MFPVITCILQDGISTLNLIGVDTVCHPYNLGVLVQRGQGWLNVICESNSHCMPLEAASRQLHLIQEIGVLGFHFFAA